MDAIPVRPSPPPPVVVAPADLAAIEEAYERGLFLDAWRLAERHGPLRDWRGARALILAGRLAGNLGAERLAGRLHLRAFREHPGPGTSPWAVRAVWRQHGPYAARTLMRRIVGADAGGESLAVAAELAAHLHDFAEAERLVARAVALAPEDPWPHVVRAIALEKADAYEAGLESVDRALELRPWFPPGVEMRAWLLVLLGRDEEALRVLEDAAARLQSWRLALELALLREEHGRHAEADAMLSRLEALTPLRERALTSWIEARRSDLAHLQGDRARAIALARRAEIPFYTNLAARLEAATDAAARLLLPVPWVRQHRLTCAPATLSALVRHFGVAAEHLEIVEAICYDGTPDHAQRTWAERQGLTVREFTVTWAAALALLDRGMPFAMTTVDPGNGHVQAVVGYDRARGTLLLRDPYSRYLGEIVGEEGLRDYAHCGPRGLVLVPMAEAHRLDGLDLPEQELHDLYHAVQTALVDHDRAAAARAAEELARRAPGHRLASNAERSLAAYDSDEPRRLRATEALLAAFPDEVNLRLSKQASLADLGRRDARIAWLRAECARAGHPLLQLALTEVLREDARAWAEALRLARAATRKGWAHAGGYHTLANVLWDAGERDEALEAYRIAACLEPTNEQFAERYFFAARLVRRAPEALEFLRDRFERQGRKSAGPALTLHEALEMLDRGREARDVLERAVAWRPDDGPLLLFAARASAAAGEQAAADELLARARTAARAVDVKRTEAQLAELRGELAEAAELWSAVAEAAPFDLEAVNAAARLLRATRDSAEAVAFLRSRVERHPHHHLLNRLLAEWFANAATGEREAAIRRLLDVNPSDAWGWRELAIALLPARRIDEALAAVAQAAEIDPHASALHSVHAAVLEEAGRREEARAALRNALKETVEDAWALRHLVQLSADGEERERDLAFVHAEIVRQVLSGDALLVYQDAAAGVLDPERLVAELRAAWDARPDLWHVWAALARQLLVSGRGPEAVALLQRAAERFDLAPRVWLELALAHGAVGDRAAKRAALERALAISPAWPEAVLPLAQVLHEDRDFAAERALLAHAVRRWPTDAQLRGWLADATWLSGEKDAALAELERALRLDPTHGWAWDALGRFSRELGRTELALALAERIARERAHDPDAWVLLARARAGTDAKLEALARALAIRPRHVAAHELRIEVLADAGRYDEALAAAEAPIEGGRVPRTLRLWAARLHAARGEPGLARLAVEELLRSEPDFAEAWAQLVEWHDAAGRHVDAAEAARRLVRLAPNRPLSHAYLGRALLGCGDRGDAKAALRRALELDPAYVWAMSTLFDAELDDGDGDGAAAALARLERHSAEDAPLARLRLLAMKRDRDGALAELDRLARADERWRLEVAAEALRRAGWSAQLDARLDALLDDPAASRAAGALFAVRAGPQGDWRRAKRRRLDGVLARPTPTPAALGAAEERLRQLATPSGAFALRRFLARHGDRLAADVGAWGNAGHALVSARRYRRTVEWLSSWRGRAGVEPWILVNLAVALRDLGREAEAAEVSAAALALPRDPASPMHEVLLATDAALAGDAAPVARLGRPHRQLGGYFLFLVELASALATCGREGDRREAFAACIARLRAAAVAKPDLWAEPYLRRVRRETLRRVALRRAGGRALAPFYWLVARTRVAGARGAADGR